MILGFPKALQRAVYGTRLTTSFSRKGTYPRRLIAKTLHARFGEHLHHPQAARTLRVGPFAVTPILLKPGTNLVRDSSAAGLPNLLVQLLGGKAKAVANRARRIGLFDSNPNREVGSVENVAAVFGEVDYLTIWRATEPVTPFGDSILVLGSQQ